MISATETCVGSAAFRFAFPGTQGWACFKSTGGVRWALVSVTDQWESDIKVADGFR